MGDAPEMTVRLAAFGPSQSDPSAILFADAAGVREFCEHLRQLRTGAWTTDLAQPPVAGEPVLHRLSLRATPTTVRVALEGDGLVIEGQPAHLARLADELALYTEHNDLDEPGMHCHVERSDYPEGDAWIALDSLPLTVAGWVPDH
jgi:hypothetical protein